MFWKALFEKIMEAGSIVTFQRKWDIGTEGNIAQMWGKEGKIVAN